MADDNKKTNNKKVDKKVGTQTLTPEANWTALDKELLINLKARQNYEIVKKRLYKLKSNEEMKRGPIGQYQATGMKITDQMYYMLFPRYVDNLVKKYNHNGAQQQAVYNAMNVNASYNVERASNNMKAYNSFLQFKNELGKSALPNGRTVTSFDWETFGGGKNEYGVPTIRGIYDYSFETIDSTGASKLRTGLIGWTEDSVSGKDARKIMDKLKNGGQLSETEKVIYNFISRVGASVDNVVKHADGKYSMSTLVNQEKEQYMTFQNFERGVQKMEEIGAEQKKMFGNIGGYKLLVDDIAEITRGGNNLMIGYNIENFDIPVIRHLINSNKELKDYYESTVGEKVNKTFNRNNAYDAFAFTKRAEEQTRSNYFSEIWVDEKGSPKPMDGKTEFQLESAHNAIYGKNENLVAHGAATDTGTNLNIVGLVKNTEGKYESVENAYTKTIEANAKFVDPSNLAADFGGDSRTAYIIPKTNGSIERMMANPNMFAYTEKDGRVYFSDGAIGWGNDTGNNLDGVISRNNYQPSMWNSQQSYWMDKDDVQIIERNSETEALFNRLEQDRPGFSGADSIVKITLNQHSAEDSVKDRKARYQRSFAKTTIFMPASEFEETFNANFNVVSTDDGDMGYTKDGSQVKKRSKKLTPTGERVQKEFYQKYSMDKMPIEVTKEENIVDYTSVRYDDIVKDNAARSLKNGTLNTAYKAVAITDITDKAGISNQDFQFLVANYINSNPSAPLTDNDKLTNVLKTAYDNMSPEERSKVEKFLGNKNSKLPFNNLEYWSKLWKIESEHGFVNGGWMDTTFAIANTMEKGSVGYQLLSALNGVADEDTRRVFNYAMSDIQGRMAKKNKNAKDLALIMGVTSQIRRERNIHEFNVGTFFKRHGPKGGVYESNTIKLNMTSPDTALRQILGSIGKTKDGMDSKYQSVVIDNFIDELIGNNELDKETRKKLATLRKSDYWKNGEMSAREKIAFLQAHLKADKKINFNYSEQGTVRTNLLDSVVWKRQSGGYNKYVKEAIDKAKEKNAIVSDNAPFMQQYVLNGRTKNSIIKDYAKSLKEAGFAEDSKPYKEAMAMFRAQAEAHIKFGKSLAEKIENTGGSLYINHKGRLIAQYDGIPIDITKHVARFSYQNGATYSTMGARAYATRFAAKLNNGKWIMNPVLESAVVKSGFVNFEKKIEEDMMAGRSKEETLQYVLGKIGEMVREKESIGTTAAKDLINNRAMEYGWIYEGNNKDNVLSYLRSVPQTKEVQDYIKSIEKFKEGDYIGSGLHNGLHYSMENGIFSNTAKLGDMEMTINVAQKDTTMQKQRMGVGEQVSFGMSSVANENRGSVYVEAGTENFLTSRLEEKGLLYKGPEAETAFDRLAFNKASEYGSTTNKIAARTMELDTVGRDALIRDAQKAGKISPEMLRKLSVFVSPEGGGAYIAGSLLEDTGYIDGVRRFNPDVKDLIDTEELRKTKASITLDDQGNIVTYYNKGFVAGKNDTILAEYSAFEGESLEQAKKASLVREEFYLGDNGPRLESEDVSRHIQKKLEEEGLEATQENIDMIAKRDLRKALVAVPLAYTAQIKTKDALTEKHEAVVGLQTIADINDKRVKQLIQSNTWQKLNKATHMKLEEALLSKEVFYSLISGRLDHALFDVLSNDERNGLALTMNKWLQSDDGNGTTIAQILREGRYAVENAVNDVVGGGQKVGYIASSQLDAIKHGQGAPLAEDAYNRAIQKAKLAGESWETVKDKFSDIIYGDGVELTEDGIRITDPNAIEVDGQNFINKIESGDIEVRKQNELYDGFVQIAPVPNEQAKKPILNDLRTRGRLFGKVWDADVVLEASRVMLAKGHTPEEISRLFGIDYIPGTAVWDTPEMNNMLIPSILEGEKAINNDKKLFLSNRDFAIYKDFVAKNPETPVSREYLKDMGRKYDLDASVEINDLLNKNDSPERVAKIAKKYGFKELNANDANWNFRNAGAEFMRSKTAMWKHNVILDLKDESIGLDDEFFAGGTSKLAIAANDDILGSNSKMGSLSLKPYQQKVQSIFVSRNRLKELMKNRKQLEGKTDDISIAGLTELDNQIKKEKDSILRNWQDVITMQKEFRDVSKKGNVLESRIKHGQALSNRSTSQVFKASSWLYDKDNSVLNAYDSLTYNGKKLRDLYKNGEQISFAVASTKDLAKFGFTDDYFARNKINKKEWLEKAKTEGINAIITRDPKDYPGSARGVQLYFSDDLNAGKTHVDAISAELMKLDSDGDNVALFALGIRGKNGAFKDVLATQMSKVSSEAERQAAERLSLTHQRAMAMDVYSLFQRKPWLDFNEPKKVDPAQYNKDVRAGLGKMLEDSIGGVFYSNSASYLSKEDRAAYQKDWEAAKDLIERANVQGAETTFNAGNAILAKPESYNMTADEIETIRKGMISHSKMISPQTIHYAKNLRALTGEVDTGFDTIDQISQLYRSKEYAVVNPKLTFSQQDINDLYYLHESGKEGFLTPKKIGGTAEITDEQRRLTKTFQENLNTAIVSSGDKQEQAFSNIEQLLSDYGKDVTSRNTAYEAGDLENGAHARRVKRGVDVLRKMVNGINYDFRSQNGSFGIRSMAIQTQVNKVLGNIMAGTKMDEESINMFKMYDMDKLMNEMYAKGIKMKQEAQSDYIANSNVAESIKRLKALDVTGDIEGAKRLLANQSGHGWSKNIAFLAGSILFTGFVGGNPATPSGQEAIQYNQQQQQQYMSPIPPQSTSSMNSMRNGPKQGYIINIQGNTNLNNTQLGNAISNAVRSNYSNSQVNINVQTQNQTDITYDQVYNYMEQSLF